MNLTAGRLVSWAAPTVALALTMGEVYFSALNGDESGAADVAESVLGALVLFGFIALGVLVVRRRPRNPVGWIIAGTVVTLGASGFAESYAVYALSTDPGSLPWGRTMAWLSTALVYPVLFAVPAMLFLLFPSGNLLSRRWRVVFWLVVLTTLATIVGSFLNPVINDAPFKGVVNPLSIDGFSALSPTLSDIGWPGMVASLLLAAVAMLLRLRRSRGVERQQLKWLAAAAAVLPLASAAGVASYYLGYERVGGPLVTFSFVPIFFAAGYAVLRYRLYDIDLLINRTLVYGSLTAMLIAVYIGGVATIQTLFRALTGQEQQPQLAVVVSTLAIAALFNPLRRRIQDFMDRLFYRRKYDARKVLREFSSRLRDDTDLDALGNDLLSVVRDSMQPAHASLWLKSPLGSGRQHQVASIRAKR